MKAYPAYKPSGVEELGPVPTDWIVKKLARVVDPSRPVTYGIVQAGEHVVDGIPYIRPTDMTEENGLIDISSILKTSPEIAKLYTRSVIKEGDLVCSIGPSFGKVMVVDASLEGANLTQGTARISVSHDCDRKFVFWALRSVNSVLQWERAIGGATFRALNLEPLARTLVAFPPTGEQRAIAAFLDREVAKIDGLIEEQRRLIALLAEKRQATISHAVTKGLNPRVKLKPSGMGWPHEIPEDWQVLSLTRVVEKFIDYRGVTPNKTDSGVPLITATQIKNGRVDHSLDPVYITEEEYRTRMTRGYPSKGDVLLTTEAPLGETALIEDEYVTMGQRIILMKPLSDVISGEYLFTHFRSQFGQNQLWQRASGSTASGIRADRLRGSYVLVPSHHEQDAIVRYVKEIIGSFEDIEAQAEEQISLLQERRSALISAAVTGKIDVRDLAPDMMEPA